LTAALTAAVLAAEVVGGLVSGSLALLADAGHVFTDLSALLIALLALRLARRPPDRRRTFGYYRAEVLAALANGLLLLGLAAALFLEALERFQHPPAVRTGPMVAVAVVGLVANAVGLRLLSPARANINVRGAFLHLLGDTISSAGVVGGGVVMGITGFYRLDPILTVVLGVVIIVGAVSLVRESVDVLLEAAPCHLDLQAVAGAIAETPGVEDVHDVHVWTISSGIVALSAHLVVAADASVADNDRLLAAVSRLLLDRFGIGHATLQVEGRLLEHVGVVHVPE
jgi:cobalt-zinc-cadmium efflux system protein